MASSPPQTVQFKNCLPPDRLSEFVLGKLPSDEWENVAAHVEQCHGCGQFIESLEPADPLQEVLRKRLAQTHVSTPCYPREAETPAEGAGLRAPMPQQLGHLVIKRQLGKGGMGTVYLAENTLMRKLFAVKVMPQDRVGNAEARSRFLREMEAVARLDHEQIVRAFFAGEEQGILYLVMEYLEGKNLREVVEEKGPVPIWQACDWICQAAAGLEHAHQKGLVHRDVKPSNLMLTPAGKVKVLDLGLARLQDHAEPLTDGGFLGTPGFLAPEQHRSPQDVQPSADVFGLAATFLYLIAGRPVRLDGDSIDKTLFSCPKELVAMIKYMLRENPRERMASAALVGRALERFRQPSASNVYALDTTGRPVATHEKKRDYARRFTSKRKLLMAASFLPCLLLLSLGAVWLVGNKEEKPNPVNNVVPGPTPNVAKPEQTTVGENSGRSAESITEVSTFGPEFVAQNIRPAQGAVTLNDLGSMAGCGDPPRRIVFSPNSRFILTNEQTGGTPGQGRRVRLWDLTLKKEIRRFGDGMPLLLPAVGRNFFSTNNGAVEIWDSITGKKVNEIKKAHREYVLGFDFKDKNQMATSGQDGLVKTWNLNTGAALFEVKHGKVAASVAFGPGNLVISGGDDDIIRVWDSVKSSQEFELVGQTDKVVALRFNATKKTLTSVSFQDAILWDFEAKKELRRVNFPRDRVFGKDAVRAIDISRDGQLVVLGKERPAHFVVIDMATGQTIASKEAHKQYVSAVGISPDNRLIVTGGVDHLLRIWELK